jgi:transcriptional regulator with XRE-family HTH domain
MDGTRHESLGQVIRRRRAELGLTQEALAERVGPTVRQAEISRLENDRVTLPRRARLELIADALELPLGMLLERSGWTGAGRIFDGDAGELGPPIASGESPPPSLAFRPVIQPRDANDAYVRSELTQAIFKSTILLRETEAIMQRVQESVLKLRQIHSRDAHPLSGPFDSGTSSL